MFMRTTLLLLALVGAASGAQAGDAAAGKANYAVCVACHGANGEGNKALNAPALAGQATWYLETQLKAYKSGIRGKAKGDMFGMQMAPMAAMLDDNGIANVSAYIATLSGGPHTDTLSGDAAQGKASYMICAACHGQNAEGNQAMAGPSLLVQQDWYLARQLQHFKSGVRGTHPEDNPGRQMRPMAMTLANDAAINNVIAYIRSLAK